MSLDKSQALNLANQYLLQRNIQAAVEIYEQIIESDPFDFAAINTLGDLYASAGRVNDSIAQFSRVAAAYAEAGLTRKAIATLKKIIAIDPANVETAIKLADLYAQAGLPSEARNHYLQIVEALTRKGQMLDALGVYNKVVDLDPLNTSGRIKLGELCLREGMNDRAFEAFVTAADQLAAQSENRRAINAYKEALAIRPNSVEVLASARRVLTLLHAPDPDKSLQTSVAPSAGRVDPSSGTSEAAMAPDIPDVASSLDQAPQVADSFVVQQISKAEILVAYGKVDQAISMLRDVHREQPDSIDVHIKLKDVYLRTGMMAEAAFEYAELERIHDSRGESERARDYAVRASRLTQLLEQPSGDLPEHTRTPVEEVERSVDAVLATIKSPLAPHPRPVAKPETRLAEPYHLTISVVPSDALPIEMATIPASELSQASESSADEALATVGIADLVSAQSPEGNFALSIGVSTEARALPVLFASSHPVKKERRRLTAAAIACAVFALLGVSVVIGGLAYDSHLDKHYQELAIASPPLAPLLPPPALVVDEPMALEGNEPITVLVTAPVLTEAPAQPPSPEPEVSKNEASARPQPASEPVKTAAQPSPLPPRVALNNDSRPETDERTPFGVPVDVPVGATHSAEPPPKAVRQSPGVVLGGTVKKVEPAYPAAAREARQAGAVAVEVIINEQGSVTSARALSGPTLLRAAALGAARAWKFRPSTLGGVPVAATTTIVFNFKL